MTICRSRDEGAGRPVRKRYDVLVVTPDRTGNSLNGTCQLDHLLMRGYDQELRNGLHQCRAYAYNGNATADEPGTRDA